MNTLKDLLEIMKEHQAADRLVQGAWLRNDAVDGLYRGCFYGCAAQSNIYPIKTICKEYSLPLWIGYWSERVFEGLPANEAIEWPVQLLTALISYTGNLYLVKHQLAIARLEPLSKYEGVQQVINCHRSYLGEELANIDWAAAESAAWSAQSAAQSAARSAARSVAWSAEAAAQSAEAAAESAAQSARSAARSAEAAAWSAQSAAESAAQSAESAARSAEAAAWSAQSAAQSAARSAAQSAEAAAVPKGDSQTQRYSGVGIAALVDAEAAAWQKERDTMLSILNN